MSEQREVSTQRLRNAADFMRDTTGVEPTWLRAAADEIDRLRRICDGSVWEENERLQSRLVKARNTAIGECMDAISNLRISEAGILDAAHSGQRGKDRSDALYDAYQEVRNSVPLSDEEGKS